MKIILKSDVENLGTFGDQVEVARGYASNYLIPQGFALEATPGNVRQFEAEKEAWLKKEQARRETADKAATELASAELVFTRRAGEEDKLFGSVTVHDISAELEKMGHTVETKDVLLEEPIKVLGEETVTLRLHPQVTADVKVKVVKLEE